MKTAKTEGFKEHALVKLVSSVVAAGKNLRRGSVGTIVHIGENTLEVEFAGLSPDPIIATVSFSVVKEVPYLTPFSHKDYQKNQAKCGTVLPCAYCGRPTQESDSFVRVLNGGGEFARSKTAFDYGNGDEAGDMGFFPVGSTCEKTLRQGGVWVEKIEA